MFFSSLLPFGVSRFEIQLFVFVALLARYFFNVLLKWKRMPPGPWGLPFVGYWPFLENDSAKQFQALGQKYGPVFGMQLGMRYAVVVNGKEPAMEYLQNDDFAARPENVMSMGPHVSHVSNVAGKIWVQQRKFFESYSKLFSKSGQDNGLNAALSRIIEVVLDEIAASRGDDMNLHQLLSKNLKNVITQALWSQSYDLIEKSMSTNEIELLQAYMLQEATPTCITGLMYFPRFESLLRKIHPRFRRQTELQIRMNKAISGVILKRQLTHNFGDDSDFLDLYLNQLSKSDTDYLNMSNLNGNLQIFITGGTETIYSSLTFFLVEMGKQQEVQDKIYNELINAFGIDGTINWAERYKTPYTMAAIYESQRHNLIVPINTVRMAKKDTKLGGYHVPKGSVVFANFWLIHNNKEDWDEPDKFKPERYLDSENNLNHKQLFLPFSAGKRVCPGKEQALIELFLFISSILRRFKVLPVSAKSKIVSGLVLVLENPMVRFQQR